MAIFGNTTIYEYPNANQTELQNRIVAGYFQMGPTGGTANTIVAYIDPAVSSGTKYIKAAIYNSNKQLITNGTTNAVGFTNSDTVGWYTFTFPSSPTLTANAYYYLVIWGENFGEACYIWYNIAGGNRVEYQSLTYTGTFPNTIIIPNSVDVDGNLGIYCNYTETVTPPTPRETYASGYLTRFQKRQIMGYHRNSGDLRAIEVNASGHLLTDVEVEVSSGLWVNGVSGVHVYVESGVHVVADIDVTVSSGIWVDGVSGVHVYQESGAFVTTQPGIQVSGAVIVSGTVAVSGRVSVLSGLVGILSGNVGISGVVGIHCSDTIRVAALKPITDASGGEEICGTGCSGPVHSVIVKNLSGNSDIFIGGSTCKPYSGFGFLLAPEEGITLDVCNVCTIYAVANTSGQKLTYIGLDY